MTSWQKYLDGMGSMNFLFSDLYLGYLLPRNPKHIPMYSYETQETTASDRSRRVMEKCSLVCISLVFSRKITYQEHEQQLLTIYTQGQRYSTGGKALVLYLTDSGLISNTAYGSPSTIRNDP